MAWVRTTLKPPREIIRMSNEIDEQQNEEQEGNDFEDDWFDEWVNK